MAWNEGATVFGGGRVEHGLSRVSVELIDVGNVAREIAASCVLTLQLVTVVECALHVIVALSP